jgi:NitT/TauT family transport system ATP-binding protein
MSGADILLMDEPFSALDPQTRIEVRRLVRRTTYDHGMLTIIATHDLFDTAYIGDRVFLLSDTRPAELTPLPVAENASPNERSPQEAAEISSALGAAFARLDRPGTQE